MASKQGLDRSMDATASYIIFSGDRFWCASAACVQCSVLLLAWRDSLLISSAGERIFIADRELASAGFVLQQNEVS